MPRLPPEIVGRGVKAWAPPQPGSRVTLRGRHIVGTLKSVNDRDWARVDWDEGVSAPKLCHLRELDVAPL